MVEIQDEFDSDEIAEIRTVGENHYIIDAKVLVSQVNDLLGLDINDEDVDTIGGWIFTEDYEVKQGDCITHENYHFTILEMEEHHIKYIEVTKVAEEKAAEPDQEQASEDATVNSVHETAHA